MKKDYIDFGIKLQKGSGEWQRASCPKCGSEKRNDTALAVNTHDEYWICHRCGSSGSLKYGWTGDFKSVVAIPPPKKQKSQTETEKFYAWFEARKIPKSIVDRNNIQLSKAYFPQFGTERGCIAFLYHIGDKLVNVKFRSQEKAFTQQKNGHKIFYKLNDIVGHDEVIITEGEIDALSFEVAGYKNCISVPDGGIQPNWKNIEGKLTFIQNSSEYLRNVKKFYLAVDNDVVGEGLLKILAKRFGKEKCVIVRFKGGCKDANESLVRYGKESLVEAIETAQPFPVEGVHTGLEFKDDVFDVYENGYPEGVKSGIDNVDELIRYHEGKLVVITGIPSHGKTTLTINLLNRYATRSDWKFAVFSPEHSTRELIVILARQIIKKHFHKERYDRMTREELEEVMDFINKHFFFIDPLSAEKDTFTINDVFDATRYLQMKYGINGLLIDSWSKIQHMASKHETETNYVQRMLNRMSAFTKKTNLNIYLIAHPTKMEKNSKGEFKIPSLYDVAGSANFYNLTDIGLTVYRKPMFDRSDQTSLIVTKMKEDWMGSLGTAKLDYNPQSLSFFQTDEIFDNTNELEYFNDYIKIKDELINT